MYTLHSHGSVHDVAKHRRQESNESCSSWCNMYRVCKSVPDFDSVPLVSLDAYGPRVNLLHVSCPQYTVC